MRNKFLTKILGATLGLAMAIGVGVGVAANNKVAAELDATVNSNVDIGEGTYKSVYETGFENKTAATSYQGTVNLSSAEGDGASWQIYYGCVSTSSKISGTKSAHLRFYLNDQTKFGYAKTTSSIPNVKAFSFSYAVSDKALKFDVDYSTNGTSWTTIETVTPSGTSDSSYSHEFASSNSTFYLRLIINSNVSYSGTSGNKTFRIDDVVFGQEIEALDTYYTVTFDSNGGSNVNSVQVADNNNTPVAAPTAPTKDGYSFAGWYSDELLQTSYNFSSPVTGDITLYAKWEKVSATDPYSPSLANNSKHRLIGEVTAITGDSYFFIQNGTSTMQINSDVSQWNIKVGNTVDLYGIYTSSGKKVGALVYCDVVSSDTTVSQEPINSISNVNSGNLYRYCEISKIKLSSGFSSKTASIAGEDVKLYYYDTNYVNSGSFEPNDYSAGDYVTIKGVVQLYNSTVEIYITSIAKQTVHTVTFNVNAESGVAPIADSLVFDGEKVEEPNPAPTRDSDENNSYSFGGWYTEAGCNNEYNFDTPVVSDITLFAKWVATPTPAKDVIRRDLKTNSSLAYHYSKEGNGTVDVLNNATTGNSTNTYKDWTNDDYSSGVDYAGKTAGENSTIQLRTKNSEEGLITTANANSFDVKKVTVVWNSATTTGRTVEVYGKNTAYSEADELFNDSNKGELLGSMSYDGSTVTNSITVNGSFKYVGIKSGDNALYLDSISIQWGVLPSYSYSNVSIRFSSLISASLWNRLNTESSIQGYGVMLSTPEAIGADPIEDWYTVADGNSYEEKIAYLATGGVKNFYMPLTTKSPDLANAAQKAGAEGDHYIWYLNKVVLDTEEGLEAQQIKNKLTQRYIAVGYIRIADELVFLDQVTASAAGLADAAITGGQATASTANGSLKNLADMLA